MRPSSRGLALPCCPASSLPAAATPPHSRDASLLAHFSLPRSDLNTFSRRMTSQPLDLSATLAHEHPWGLVTSWSTPSGASPPASPPLCSVLRISLSCLASMAFSQPNSSHQSVFSLASSPKHLSPDIDCPSISPLCLPSMLSSCCLLSAWYHWMTVTTPTQGFYWSILVGFPVGVPSFLQSPVLLLLRRPSMSLHSGRSMSVAFSGLWSPDLSEPSSML